MARRRSVLRTAVLVALAAVLGAASAVAGLWLALPDPARLARENPRTTALIEQRRAEAHAARRPFRPRQAWIPLERISPVLAKAVLASEDANFFGHDGIDWEAIRDAAEHDIKVGRFARGASTVTQQLARNLWLGTEKSLWRKAKEAVLAAKLERALSKKRILALYLNVAEMGDGVFGVEAGARERFGTSAAALSPAQAVVLASLLPAPRRADLSRPSTWLKTRSRRLLDRLRDHGRLTAEEHLAASAELERILAGPKPRDDREEPPEEEQAGAPPPPAPRPPPAVPQPPPEPEPPDVRPADVRPAPAQPPGAQAGAAAGTAAGTADAPRLAP
jgi:monofunctional biosynthetic peptidoglycan transglycosylase